MSTPMTDTQKLREAAKRATPGDWIAENTMGDIVMIFQADASDVNGWGACVAQVGLTPADETDLTPEQAEANAVYIAAANPATIIALCDEIDRLRAGAAPPAPAVAVKPLEWRNSDRQQPERGRRFVAIHADGSGAFLAYRHDAGYFDQDADDFDKLAADTWWTYTPQEVQLWAESHGEEGGGGILHLPESSALASPPAVESGWKIVPVEPTEEMVNAWLEELSRQGVALDAFSPAIFPVALYRAMLAASPTPKGGE